MRRERCGRRVSPHDGAATLREYLPLRAIALVVRRAADADLRSDRPRLSRPHRPRDPRCGVRDGPDYEVPGAVRPGHRGGPLLDGPEFLPRARPYAAD